MDLHSRSKSDLNSSNYITDDTDYAQNYAVGFKLIFVALKFQMLYKTIFHDTDDINSDDIRNVIILMK